MASTVVDRYLKAGSSALQVSSNTVPSVQTRTQPITGKRGAESKMKLQETTKKDSSVLRKTKSVGSENSHAKNVSREKLTRAPSYDADISPVTTPSGLRVPLPKPISIGQSAAAKLSKSAPADQQQKNLYHAISPELLSVSPLQPSPSMALLGRTAEVLLNGEHLRRMPVQTTTQVFEVRKASAPGPSTKMTRQESLLAVFKPATDEEDSLLVKSESSFRFNAEERALRERAAYVLDKIYLSFSRVPATALARVQDSNGSLQQYVRSNGTAEDNPMLVGKASAAEVQRIAILDCRILNLDRHGGNVLVSREGQRENSKSLEDESGFLIGDEAFDEPEGEIILTPIDHSLSLPPWRNLGEAWFDWTFWPQSEEPLTQTSRDYVHDLDVVQDTRELTELGIQPECVATNHICTLALQALVRGNPDITPRALGEFFQRPYSVGHKLHHMESPLEHIVNEACTRANQSRDELVPSDAFYEKLKEVLDEQTRDDSWRAYVV